jgi:hypothetical protein|tara:strand:+ start:448 stop:711 length:264 start_codon:yes stop_codon:yes gene_type:complete
MGNNSQWIETELERGEEIYLVPLRSRLETRKNRLRTVIQRLDDGVWNTVHKTDWVKSNRAHYLPPKMLDNAAEELADSLIAQVEKLL